MQNSLFFRSHAIGSRSGSRPGIAVSSRSPVKLSRPACCLHLTPDMGLQAQPSAVACCLSFRLTVVNHACSRVICHDLPEVCPDPDGRSPNALAPGAAAPPCCPGWPPARSRRPGQAGRGDRVQAPKNPTDMWARSAGIITRQARHRAGLAGLRWRVRYTVGRDTVNSSARLPQPNAGTSAMPGTPRPRRRRCGPGCPWNGRNAAWSGGPCGRRSPVRRAGWRRRRGRR